MKKTAKSEMLSEEARLCEVILFVENVPTSLDRLSELTGLKPDIVEDALQELRDDYSERGSGLILTEDENEIICKFIPPLENEVTISEKTKNLNQYWRIKMLDILEQMYPKKEYIDMDAYISRSMTKDGWCVHPLPLMTSTGGDQGGGDYHEGYICQSYVGEWAYDEITIKDKAPKGKDFTLLNVTFSEEIEVVIEGVC